MKTVSLDTTVEGLTFTLEVETGVIRFYDYGEALCMAVTIASSESARLAARMSKREKDVWDIFCRKCGQQLGYTKAPPEQQAGALCKGCVKSQFGGESTGFAAGEKAVREEKIPRRWLRAGDLTEEEDTEQTKGGG